MLNFSTALDYGRAGDILKKIGTIAIHLLLLLTLINTEEIADYEHTRISRKRDLK
jgi:hypothetical protein